jgi:hypothetical protein
MQGVLCECPGVDFADSFDVAIMRKVLPRTFLSVSLERHSRRWPMKEECARPDRKPCLPGPHPSDGVNDPPWAVNGGTARDIATGLVGDLHFDNPLRVSVEENWRCPYRSSRTQGEYGHDPNVDAAHLRLYDLVASATNQESSESNQESSQTARSGRCCTTTGCFLDLDQQLIGGV